MVFTDYLFLDMITLLITFYFSLSFNITLLLFIACTFLLITGVTFLIKDLDIFIGFLWVIDLGVGLIFFIFILHFSAFLQQKSVFNSTSKQFFYIFLLTIFTLFYFYFFSKSKDSSIDSQLEKVWFLDVVCFNFFSTIFNNDTGVLLMIKHCYFTCNSFEFFLINYSLFFGLMCSILSCFLIKRFYIKLVLSQIEESKTFENVTSGFFIKNQNFFSQQNVCQITRLWMKLKKN